MADESAPLVPTEGEVLKPDEPMEEATTIPVPEEVKNAEKAALNVQKKLNIQGAPIRTYLEASVVAVLMQGLQSLCKERPDNPVEYLAYYLLAHNPQNPKPPAKAAPPPPATEAEAAPGTQAVA